MILRCHLDNNSYFDIQLIQDEFVHWWATNIVDFKLAETEQTTLTGGGDDSDPDTFYVRLRKLLEGVSQIPEILGCPIPSEFKTDVLDYDYEDKFDTQHQMNIIHRWVVSTSHQVPYSIDNSEAIRAVQKDPSICQYPGLIWKLNKLVHDTEATYSRPRHKQWVWGEHVFWDQDFVFDDRSKLRFHWDEKYDYLFTTRNHDVWLAKRILGKDYREAWIDNDDPTAYDVTNIDRVIGWAFEVDPLTDTESFYNSDSFKDWMASYSKDTSDRTIGRVPLGNIVDRDTYDWNGLLKTTHISRLEII